MGPALIGRYSTWYVCWVMALLFVFNIEIWWLGSLFFFAQFSAINEHGALMSLALMCWQHCSLMPFILCQHSYSKTAKENQHMDVWTSMQLHLFVFVTCPCSVPPNQWRKPVIALLLLQREPCLTSLKVDLALPHQMVLEDNIHAKAEHLDWTALRLVLTGSLQMKWYIYEYNYNMNFDDSCKCILCFIRRTGGLLLQLLICWSTATLARKYIPLHGNNLNTCKRLLRTLNLLFCQSRHVGRIWSHSGEIPSDSVSH